MDDLLSIAGIPRSTFYYQLRLMRKGDKDKALKKRIASLYFRFMNKNESFGYRRIYALLRNIRQFRNVNHKKVQRIMKELGLQGYISRNGYRRYSSYKGKVGKIADNVLNRRFDAARPNTVWSTDVTEFRLTDSTKVYLSPIKDFCDGSIISYSYSTSPGMKLVMDMLDKAFDKNRCLAGLVLHSDQGYQYQNPTWVRRLDDHCIIQSMSRKGNCLDNSKMETFFSTLKKAIWFGREKEYRKPEDLYSAIDEYITWYNERRIQVKLKGMTPLQYRKLTFKMTSR